MMKIDNPPWELMAKAKGTNKTASGPVVSVNDALAAPLRSLVANIEPVQEGSGDPSPDNVRPISGWSAVNVWRTGKNLVRLSADNYNEVQRATVEDTESGLIITARGTYGRVGYVIHNLKAGQTYTFSLRGSSTGDFNNVYLNNNTQWGSGTDRYATINLGTAGDKSATFTAIDETLYIGFYVTASGTSGVMNVSNIQLELDSTASAYEPYSSNQYTLQLGQTVYSGTQDVTNGGLTVRPYYGSYNGEPLVGPWISSMDAYAPGATPTTGAQVVDLGATPITIPLTPTQISTLQGQNNVWADSGDVELAYKSNSPDESLMKLAIAFMNRR